MSLEQIITGKLTSACQPIHLEVINESHNHNVPPGSESHFKVTIVSDVFNELTLLKRHQFVNKTLAEELQSHIHALALHTLTSQEWEKKHNTVPSSPPCLGGSKT